MGDTLEDILKGSFPSLEENSVVVITSKIVSITQGNVVKIGTANKEDLVRQQADKIFVNPNTDPAFKTLLTITNNIFVPWAGIDESNGNGYYILWPKNPMQEAEKIWNFLRNKYHLKNLGVLIVDSTFVPLRTGPISVGLSWCGFAPIKQYIGTPDIFGEPLKYTTASLVDTISVAAGLAMGEGAEQTPLVVVQDIPGIIFLDRPPSNQEKTLMHYPLEKDMFGSLIESASWEKGENRAAEE